MFTNTNDQDQRKEEKQETQGTEDIRKRLNPRLVFTDPDMFFNDLLMEQCEQS